MADPLVFLHPFPLDASFWDELIEVLPHDRPMRTVDFPGFGRDEPTETPSIVGVADAVAQGIRQNGEPAVVVGCSMGGFLALSVVARHPECVSGLILTGTGAADDPPERRAERDQAITRIAREGPSEFAAEFASSLLARPAEPEVERRVAEMASRASASAVPSGLAALRDRPDRRAGLRHIRAPTLVIAGEDDPRTPRTAMQELADQIPMGRLVLVPGAGHLAPLEKPDAFAAHMTAFLQNEWPGEAVRPTA